MRENEELSNYDFDEIKEKYSFKFNNCFILGFIGIVLIILGTKVGCDLYSNKLEVEKNDHLEIEDCSLRIGNYCVTLPEEMEFKSVDDKFVFSNRERKLVVVMESVSGEYSILANQIDSLKKKYVANGYIDVSCQVKEYNNVQYIDIMFLKDGRFGKTIFMKDSEVMVLSLVMVADALNDLEYAEDYMMSLLQQVRNRELIA